jgi:DNA helicase-2/ATP-dependent DNA helicase PcrA
VTAAAAPLLTGDAKKAVEYRGGHLQIIASAGSGKTEVVSQRITSLLEEGIAPRAIVAFTFTERAASSLKSRIERRVSEKLGDEFLNSLNGMFVGTIHSYCFQLLQEHVPQFEAYDVLDEHRLTAFLTREAYNIGLVPKVHPKLFKAIANFGSNLNIIENELLEPDQLNEPLRGAYEAYLASLDDHRFLTYGQQIARAVQALRIREVFDQVHQPLRHVIVDEYQDINPAQEALIARLAMAPVHLCVVGDDDQSIYQWRGSDVSNIITFSKRYASVATFSIETNRRSRPAIIDAANSFAKTIEGRLSKKPMGMDRSASDRTELTCWAALEEQEQAVVIAETIRTFHDEYGYAFREIAVLCRGKVSFEALLEAFKAKGVPVQPGGRTLLFAQPEADLLGRTICWLVDYAWRVGNYGWRTEPVGLDDLVKRYGDLYKLSPAGRKAVRDALSGWKNLIDDDKPANLVRDFYAILEAANVKSWDLTDPWTVNRLGTLARCSQVLVDYEATRRRARPKTGSPGEIKSPHDRGKKYFEWLAKYIQNWARGAYAAFEGEEDIQLDAVDLTTIHQAKGLEWPVVFVPSLTSRRFPTSLTGQAQAWMVPEGLFDAARYRGSVNDERRLFYVAMTRAHDYLSLSAFEFISNAQPPSLFLTAVAGETVERLAALPAPPEPDPSNQEEGVLEITFSDLSVYQECGLSYRFRRMLGFQPPIVPELGYGKAVHHILRSIAEFVRHTGSTPTDKQLDAIFDAEFYVPAATVVAHRQMRQGARKLVDAYISEWESDLHNTWAVERPFELHLGDATVSGRADVIIDEGGGVESLAIVDYKTAADGHTSHDFQLQVYTDAGRREGLNVSAAFVHDLKNATRQAVAVDPADIGVAEAKVNLLVKGLRSKDYSPDPGEVCTYCDVRSLCAQRADIQKGMRDAP